MAAITVFARNPQQVQFQGMMMGLQYSEPRKFLTTFYGDRDKIEGLAKRTKSIIVERMDIEMM
jgi:hypothetical protein